MTKRTISQKFAAVFAWSCVVSLTFTYAGGAEIGLGNVAYVVLDGAVMFVLSGFVPGLIYLLFKHKIENPIVIYGLWGMVIAFVGLGNFAAWSLL